MNLHALRCPHREHTFAGTLGVSRRAFLGSAAGFAIGSGLATKLGAQNGNPHVNAFPKPIPGGVSPFGIPIHHFPVSPSGTPLANFTEPSQITDFNSSQQLVDKAVLPSFTLRRAAWPTLRSGSIQPEASQQLRSILKLGLALREPRVAVRQAFWV